MTSEEKVKAAHPRARPARYTTHGRQVYYLIWSDCEYRTDSRRLGEGKTASSAWVDAARKIADRNQRAAAALAPTGETKGG